MAAIAGRAPNYLVERRATGARFVGPRYQDILIRDRAAIEGGWHLNGSIVATSGPWEICTANLGKLFKIAHVIRPRAGT
jgi:hypothetical protein